MTREGFGMTLIGLGFLLMFGAVGGMDNPEQAEYLAEQTAAAVVGLLMMFGGTSLVKR